MKLARVFIILFAAVCFTSLSSCNSTNPYTQQNTQRGAVLGGVTGAIIGNNTSMGSWGGAAAGAVVGGLVGHSYGNRRTVSSSSPNRQFDFKTKW